MSYYVLIRGPLGSGKSTVSERLAKILRAEYVSIDRILDESNLEEWEGGYISERSFLRANELASRTAKDFLTRGTPVIFDGNFYWKPQIADLIDRLNFPHHIFTLKAPLEVCVERDGHRHPPHGRTATERVYAKSTEFEAGLGIDAAQSVDRVVSAIVARLRSV
ncbi:MAG: ATP-binding protein [Thermoplasmata archaeon]